MLLCIISFLFPIVGLPIGIWGTIRDDRQWQNTGKSMVVVSLIACALFGGLYAWDQWTRLSAQMQVSPPSPITARIVGWREVQQLPFGGEYTMSAPQGKKFLITSVSVQNPSDRQITVFADGFELVCDNKNVYRSMGSDYDIDTLSATLLPGGYTNGDVVFEVDANTKPLSIKHDPLLY
jgi:hypothetical protein